MICLKLGLDWIDTLVFQLVCLLILTELSQSKSEHTRRPTLGDALLIFWTPLAFLLILVDSIPEPFINCASRHLQFFCDFFDSRFVWDLAFVQSEHLPKKLTLDSCFPVLLDCIV